MEIIKRHKNSLFALVLSFSTYVVFFGQFLTPSHYFWSSEGSLVDAQTKHVPARTYLYEKIVHEHSFPFWTERMYSGFPIYADPENAYLNPANVASTLIFGPQLSYKMLHLLEYLVGSLSLYLLLKRKGIGLLGYAASNAIFYFNAFFINHQMHFNMIMALYLIPTVFLLADLFLEKKQLRYIIFESLVIANAVLWGHMQSAVIMCLGLFAYMAVFSYKKTRFLTFAFFFFALVFFVTIETLPQVLPTQELFAESRRSSGTDYLKGSLNPRMAIFSFVPYLLGESRNFISQDVIGDFSYGEVYIYSGISSLLLSVLALLFLKKSRVVVLAFVFIWIFLIFGFMASNNIFPSGTPVITLFREWERTAVLSGFGIALLAGIFVEKIREVSYKNIKIGILFVLAPIIYIWMLVEITGGKIARISKRLSPYTSYDHIQNYPYFPLLETIVLVVAGVLLVFWIVKKISPRVSSGIFIPVKIIVVAVVFFDLIFFSKDVLSLRLQDISAYKIASIPDELKNRRVMLKHLNVSGMESLYYNNWSPFGTSQLKENDYVEYYEQLGVDLRGVTSSNIVLLENFKNLKDAGVVAVTQPSGTVLLNDNKLDILKNNPAGYYIEKEEGEIVMQINSPSDSIMGTYLKYSPHWRIKVDGEDSGIVKNGVFFDFSLKQGGHLVEIKYVPWPLFRGLLLSALLLASAVTLYYLFKKNLYARILHHEQ